MKFIIIIISLLVITLILCSCSSKVTSPDNQTGVPEFKVISCTPNPFTDENVFTFNAKVGSYLSLKIVNNAGEIVKTFYFEQNKAGTHQIVWDGTNEQGNKVASGVYLYKMDNGAYTATAKVFLIK